MAAALLAITVAPARAALVDATEFYNTDLKHYFVTSYAEEIAGIEAGSAGPGWIRTGGSFRVYTSANDAPGLSAVCRFYGTPGRGPNSHFYTAEPAECDAVKRDPGWTYEGIAFYVRLPAAGQCPGDTLPVYRSYNNGWVRNDSNHRFTIDYAATMGSKREGFQPEAVVFCSPMTAADRRRDAFRLQQQATFGPLPEVTDRIVQIGPAAWVDEQLGLPTSRYTQYPWFTGGRPEGCTNGVFEKPPPWTPGDYCVWFNHSTLFVETEFMGQAIQNADQLRQRVAWAWAQIFVVSGDKAHFAYGMADYQQMLRDRALGDFRSLLRAVTLSAMMGYYLDLGTSSKAMNGISPNENFPRELLQLFSIGTVMLGPDGSVLRDANGKPIPSYGQDHVTAFARALTGWSWPSIDGTPRPFYAEQNLRGEMVPWQEYHDTGAKTLLGRTIPAGGTARADAEAVIDDLMAHPNLPPFISRLLIQRLVTGDPSPDYVKRVADVFRNNGLGAFGDLRAVVRAILLDPEARGPQKIDVHWGKLIEPVRIVTTLARIHRMDVRKSLFQTSAAIMRQQPFNAGTVFNFFPADHTLPGLGVNAPEFALLNASLAILRFNQIYAWTWFDNTASQDRLEGYTGQRIDVAPFRTAALDTPRLIALLDELYTGGQTPREVREALAEAVDTAYPPPLDSEFFVDSKIRYTIPLLLSTAAFHLER